MKKKALVIVAVIALVAILGVCLVACNMEDYKKRLEDEKYLVVSASAEQLGIEDADIEWALAATKLKDSVYIVKFAKTADAKDFVEKAKQVNKLDSWKVERSGKIVFSGTEQAIKDAK